jgi:RNA polymerase sigma-70 factor (family 1)
MPQLSAYADDKLVLLLQAGDADAFTELYVRYWKLLFYIAAKRLRNYAEAEEAVQNIYTDLWTRRKTRHIHTSIKYYLATAVQYQVMNFLSKKNKQASLEFSENERSTENADQMLSLHELQQQVEGIVNGLPEKCRLVYQLSRVQGLTNKDIARQLGISDKTVENQLTKALARIRAGLGDLRLLLVLMAIIVSVHF